jgi:hypothetical protein
MRTLIRIRYDGQELEGALEEIEHPMHFMYHIRFNNGYENIFFTDAETGEWIEQDLGASELAEIVGEKLDLLLPPNREISRLQIKWLHATIGEKIIHFGYHRYLLDEFIVFEIFAPNKRFLYTLVKLRKDHWKVFRLSDTEWSGDNIVLYDLPFILEKYVLTSII